MLLPFFLVAESYSVIRTPGPVVRRARSAPRILSRTLYTHIPSRARTAHIFRCAHAPLPRFCRAHAPHRFLVACTLCSQIWPRARPRRIPTRARSTPVFCCRAHAPRYSVAYALAPQTPSRTPDTQTCRGARTRLIFRRAHAPRPDSAARTLSASRLAAHAPLPYSVARTHRTYIPLRARSTLRFAVHAPHLYSVSRHAPLPYSVIQTLRTASIHVDGHGGCFRVLRP